MSGSTKQTNFGSRLGFILASAGSAVGLGAIWKFPYMAGTNGGAVFMLPYIFFTVTVGMALLLLNSRWDALVAAVRWAALTTFAASPGAFSAALAFLLSS